MAHRKIIIYFVHKSAIWVGLSEDRSSITMSTGAAQLELEDPPPRLLPEWPESWCCLLASPWYGFGFLKEWCLFCKKQEVEAAIFLRLSSGN